MSENHSQTFVIVGASMAGARGAETLRREGFAGRVVLVGAEPELPYERPPLSKGFLSGDVREGDFALGTHASYDEQGIELRLGTRAVRLDAATREVELDNGERLGFDRLLIATGATPRRLPPDVDGADLGGVHVLRTVADARAIRDALANVERVAVIGMGFIGAEVAATARTLGKTVTAIEAGPVPMLAALGLEVAERLLAVHRERGVEVQLHTAVTGFVGSERIERVVTSEGAVDCDLAVIGIGVVPDVGWLADSGIEIERGIVVDEYCRTNLPDVYAAGDVASSFNPRYGRHLHLEHFDNAGEQGAAAAKAMLDGTEPYAPVPSFWSDQYDLAIQQAGITDGYDQVVFRGPASASDWAAFYLRDGAYQAVVTVNRGKDFSIARRLLRQGTPVTAEQLADEHISLRDLMGR